MSITVTIEDELAGRLRPYEGQLAEILDWASSELQARQEAGYAGLSSVLEKLVSLPTSEEVIALRPSGPQQERIDALLTKNRVAGFSPEDQREWDQFQYIEHLVRLAKANAFRKLQESAGT